MTASVFTAVHPVMAAAQIVRTGNISMAPVITSVFIAVPNLQGVVRIVRTVNTKSSRVRRPRRTENGNMFDVRQHVRRGDYQSPANLRNTFDVCFFRYPVYIRVTVNDSAGCRRRQPIQMGG